MYSGKSRRSCIIVSKRYYGSGSTGPAQLIKYLASNRNGPHPLPIRVHSWSDHLGRNSLDPHIQERYPDIGLEWSYKTFRVGIALLRMLKLTKKADYGLIALRHLALGEAGVTASAKEMADAYGLPAPATVQDSAEIGSRRHASIGGRN